MKIKTDFVTNSSSTSFLFVIRGNSIEDLYVAMKNNWPEFELTGNTDVYDIISYAKHSDIEPIEHTIGEAIEELKKDIKDEEAWLRKNNVRDNPYRSDWGEQKLQNQKVILEQLEYKQKKGFKTAIELQFSNHDKIGSVVSDDLQKIDKDNLFVISLGYNG